MSGDTDFTAANGVLGGDGTVSNPYVLSGWEIDATSSHGIKIRDTRAYFVIRDVYVHSGRYDWYGIALTNVTNGRIERANLRDNNMGILARDSADLVVENIDAIDNGGQGIQLSLSLNVTVSSSNFTSNGEGVRISGSDNVVITNSTFQTNWARGVFLESSTNITLLQNTFQLDGVMLWGSSIEHFASHRIPSDNLVNGKPLHYFSNCQDLVIDRIVAGQVLAGGCSNVRVTNLRLSGATVAIELGFVNQALVAGNNIADVGSGIVIASSTNATIRNNDVRNHTEVSNHFPVDVRSSVNATIEGNLVSSLGEVGIFLYGASGALARRNYVTGVRHAIELSVTTNSTVEYNLVDSAVVSNRMQGVSTYDSNNVSFRGNNLAGAFQGLNLNRSWNMIAMENRISDNLQGIVVDRTRGAVVSCNDIIDNAWDQGWDDSGPENRWDAGYPDGGNYWSDYGGSDFFGGPLQDQPGADGIGDTPYVIDSDSADRYPRMTPCPAMNSPPVARFAVSPPFGGVGTPFVFNASASWDAETHRDVLEVRWDWEDDGTWDTPWSSGKLETHVFPSNGLHSVRLAVRDGDGLTNETVREVLVEPSPDYVPSDPQPAGTATTGLARAADLSLRVANGGVASTSDATVALYNETTPGQPFAEFTIPPLGDGAISAPLIASWPSPGVPGSYRVAADVDYGDNVTEGDETNNLHVWTIQVVPGPVTSLVLGAPNYTETETFVTSATPISLAIVDLSGTGIRETKYRVDGGPWGSYVLGSSFRLSEETEHLVEWYSEDNAGNVEGASGERLRVDDSPPTSSLSPLAGPYEVTTVFTLNASDEGSGILRTEYRLDGGAWAMYVGGFPLPQGIHTIGYRSVDRLGNTEAERIRTVTVQPTPEMPLTTNWKPLVALVFALILALAGAWSSWRRSRRSHGDSQAAMRVFAMVCLPFVLAEVATGIASIATGLFAIPPVVGVGTLVDGVILAVGVGVAIVNARVSPTGREWGSS